MLDYRSVSFSMMSMALFFQRHPVFPFLVKEKRWANHIDCRQRHSYTGDLGVESMGWIYVICLGWRRIWWCFSKEIGEILVTLKAVLPTWCHLDFTKNIQVALLKVQPLAHIKQTRYLTMDSQLPNHFIHFNVSITTWILRMSQVCGVFDFLKKIILVNSYTFKTQL